MKKDRLLSRESLLVLLLLICCRFLVSQPQAEGNVQGQALSGWKKTKDVFDRFLREPTPGNSLEFFASIPEEMAIDGEGAAVLSHIFQYEGYRYGIVNMEMLHGDIYAARSAIRLMKFIEGERHEIVGKSLGRLARVKPAVFLRACHEEREDPHVKENGFLVGFIPAIMKKKERASYELGKRLEALRSVDAPELQAVRDECIKRIEKTMEGLGLEVPRWVEEEERRWDDPREQVKSVLRDIQSIPSPENMKRLLALFSDDRDFNVHNVVQLILYNAESIGKFQTIDPIDLVLHEASCGNEYAIEVLLRTCRYVWGYPTERIFISISNLILINPALFIEKLAKYRKFLESMEIIDCIDWICRYISWAHYPEGMDHDVILRRRIEALEGLDLPEHKELIDHCIGLIKKKLK